MAEMTDSTAQPELRAVSASGSDGLADAELSAECEFCGGVLLFSTDAHRWLDLVGGWLCLRTPPTETQRHHRPRPDAQAH